MDELFFGFFKGRRILITGHTGFKGAWLSQWLLSLGAELTGASLPPPTQPNMYSILGLQQRMNSIQVDVRDYENLAEIVSKASPELIFHLAAQSLVRRSYRNPLETFMTNVMGTVNIIEAFRSSEATKVLIVITSDKCYEDLPVAGGFTEENRIGGSDPYSASKGCAELITASYGRSFFNEEKRNGKYLASVRAGNVIGGGDWAEDRLIPDCIRSWESGIPLRLRYPYAVRPWQHVLEPLRGYLQLAQKLFFEGRVFSGAWNFGPDMAEERSVIWVVKKMVSMGEMAIGYESEPTKTDPESQILRLDSEKAMTQLAWKCCWSIETTLKKTIDWYRAFRKGINMTELTLNQIKEYETECGKTK